jgi:hypothetical protein
MSLSSGVTRTREQRIPNNMEISSCGLIQVTNPEEYYLPGFKFT